MSGHVLAVQDLVIPNGQQSSNVLSADIRDADALTIIAPATLPEAVTVQYSADGVTFAPLQLAGADVGVPAGKAIILEMPTALFLRLQAGGAVGANRTFKVAKSVYV